MRAKLLSLTMVLALVLGAVAWPTPADAVEPSNNITAIDTKTGMVTAREAKTGRTFQFKVADANFLRSLKVGQAVHADFTTMKVSVNLSPAEPSTNFQIVNVRRAATPVR